MMKKIIVPFIHALIITIIFIILFVVMVLLKYKAGIWILTTGILELSFGLLWLFSSYGMFSSTQYGFRRFANSSVNRRKEKIGVYEEKKEKLINIKEYESSAELENKINEKNRLRIYFVIGFGIFIILISIPWNI